MLAACRTHAVRSTQLSCRSTIRRTRGPQEKRLKNENKEHIKKLKERNVIVRNNKGMLAYCAPALRSKKVSITFIMLVQLLTILISDEAAGSVGSRKHDRRSAPPNFLECCPFQIDRTRALSHPTAYKALSIKESNPPHTPPTLTTLTLIVLSRKARTRTRCIAILLLLSVSGPSN